MTKKIPFTVPCSARRLHLQMGGRLMALSLLSLAAITTAGCQNLRPSADDFARLESVHLLPVIEKEVTYSGKLPSEYESDQGNGLLGNPYTAPIGFFVELFSYGKTQKRRQQRLRQIFSAAKLDVPATLHASFSRAFNEDDALPELADEKSETSALIELETSYGLIGASFTGETYSPWVTVTGVMRDAKGNEIWRHEARAEVGDGNVRELPFPDPFLDSKLVRRQYRAAVKAVTRALLDHLTYRTE